MIHTILPIKQENNTIKLINKNTSKNRLTQNSSNKENDNSNQSKSSSMKQVLIVLSGWWGISKAETFLKKRTGKYIKKAITKSSREINIPKEKVEEIAKKMIKTHNLDQKGFEYYLIDNSLDKSTEIIENKFEKGILKLFNLISSDKELRAEIAKDKKFDKYFQYPKEISKVCAEIISDSIVKEINSVRRGKNAFFHPLINTAFSSENKSPFKSYAILHEIGHAINFNSLKSKGKVLHYISLLSTKKLFIPLIFLISALHNKTDKKNKSLTEKTKDFIQNNAGKLTFLACSPLLIEEARASKNALKFAKNDLNKIQYKALKKTLTIAFGSYLLGATISSLAVKFGLYVKNKLSEPQK